MTTTDAEPIFIDTNILIYANNRASDLCKSARKKLDELTGRENSLVISYQVLREYLVIMTRPGLLKSLFPLGPRLKMS